MRHSAGEIFSPGGAGAAWRRRRRRHHPPIPPRAELGRMSARGRRSSACCLRCRVSSGLAHWHSCWRRGRGGRGRSRNPLPHDLLVVCGYGDVGSWLCDVLVIMPLLFQQSKVYVNMTVSQIQFIGRVLDNPVTPQGQVRTVLTCADYWRPHRCSALQRLLTHPLWCNDRCRVVQTVLVDNGSGKFMAGFCGYSHLLLCSLRLSA